MELLTQLQTVTSLKSGIHTSDMWEWQIKQRIARSEPDGMRWRTGGEVKGKHASGVGSQQSCTLPQNMVYPALQPILPQMCAPRLPVVDWTDPPRQFKWTRPFCWKTKSGFCACAITFRTCYNTPCCLNTSPTLDYSGPACWYFGQFRRSVLMPPLISALKKRWLMKNLSI